MKIIFQSFNEQNQRWKTEDDRADDIAWFLFGFICLALGFMLGLDYAGIQLVRGGG